MRSTTRPSSPGVASPAFATATGSRRGSGGSSSTAAATDCGRAGAGRSSWRSRRSARPTPDCRSSSGPDAGIALATRDELERAFARLEPEQAVVVALRYYADLTVPQIATRLGIAEGTVKSRLHHALRRLRTTVERPEETER